MALFITLTFFLTLFVYAVYMMCRNANADSFLATRSKKEQEKYSVNELVNYGYTFGDYKELFEEQKREN